ncbi:hypothetical protein GCM10007874_51130 [Labrys miyagiensis]|uniref:Uncharacterized protein n=1 Tax=Labrys miyagiensis TaxID=346912 RepID=A0ABQ6CP42_9HYPH|nr:hypothetical protein [Labrys miyagiensis]GLS22096.1 hypothetical protein GCM10007874_51130 [Labrys miyagiensis]
MSENVDNSLMTEVLKEIRKPLRDQGTLLSRIVEILGHHSNRFNAIENRFDLIEGRLTSIDRRFHEQTVELETIIRGEMLGARTNFEIQWEDRLHDLDERIKALEDKAGT